MNDDVKAQANEAFQNALAELEAVDKPKSATPLALSMPAISGATICDQAPALIKSAIGLVDSFSWFIPDNVERPLKAFLISLRDVIMPAFCSVAASPETVGKKS